MAGWAGVGGVGRCEASVREVREAYCGLARRIGVLRPAKMISKGVCNKHTKLTFDRVDFLYKSETQNQ